MWNEAAGTFVFYLIAFFSIFTALTVVYTRRILRAAIALACVLVCSAGFYVMLDFEFLAGVQVMVYVGGIVVLMLFAIMLTSSAELIVDRPSFQRRFVGVLISIGFFFVTTTAFWATDFPVAESTKDTLFTKVSIEGEKAEPLDDVVELGKKLLDYGPEGYVLPFEIISLLLLSVMIGGIIIARKPPQLENKE
ncbi:MAG: NADH-quinone oxidoreductase subunit J [SAR324 cluster bacterium]|nr:NADH-quinone oxidoreductase subunit J [SAR324 cluster bacterium]